MTYQSNDPVNTAINVASDTITSFRPEPPLEECAIEFDMDRRPFPVNALPATLREFVIGVSKLTRTTHGLVSCCALGTLSAAIRKGLRVQSLPGKTAPANLYILVGAPSGTGKSLAYGEVVAAMANYETLQGSLGAKNKTEAGSSNADVATAAVHQLQAHLDDASTPDEEKIRIRSEMQELEQAINGLTNERRPPRLICEDTTPAALVKLLAAQGQAECVASLSPDARDIVNRLSSRNQSNRGTLEGIFLKAYTEDGHQIDRGNQEPIRLRKPNVTCLWLVQPDLMHQIFTVTKLAEGGLLPRFLVHSAECKPQQIDRATQVLMGDVRSRWETLITTVIDRYGLSAETFSIGSDAEATALMDNHFNELALRRLSDLSDVNTYASRWNENAWRIALVLHVAEHGAAAHKTAVSIATAKSAMEVMDWFSAEQLDILDASREAVYKESVKQIRKLVEANPTGITSRDVTRARICATGTDANALIEKMRNQGLLRREEIPPAPNKGGKTKIVFHLV